MTEDQKAIREEEVRKFANVWARIASPWPRGVVSTLTDLHSENFEDMLFRGEAHLGKVTPEDAALILEHYLVTAVEGVYDTFAPINEPELDVRFTLYSLTRGDVEHSVKVSIKVSVEEAVA